MKEAWKNGVISAFIMIGTFVGAGVGCRLFNVITKDQKKEQKGGESEC